MTVSQVLASKQKRWLVSILNLFFSFLNWCGLVWKSNGAAWPRRVQRKDKSKTHGRRCAPPIKKSESLKMVLSVGIEPTLRDPQSRVLSIEL